MLTKRGALIILEGCDRAGKSTQSKLLIEALHNKNIPVKKMIFPDRSTTIGEVIDKYLKNKSDLPDQAIHLLYAANRWELMPKIKSSLLNGETIIVDRYSFSGVAYTAAKGLSLEWCKAQEIGLPKPDMVFFLNVTNEETAQRGEYGQERYDNIDFQEKVKNVYHQLKDDSYWKVIEANRAIETIHEEILGHTLDVIKNQSNLPIQSLWENHLK